MLQIITEADAEIPGVAAKIVEQLPGAIHDHHEQKKIIDLLVNLLMHRLPNLSRKEIEKMFDTILLDIKKSRAYQEIAQEAAYENKRTIALAMAKKKMNLALISELTGLSKAEVLEIAKDLNHRQKSRKLGKPKKESY